MPRVRRKPSEKLAASLREANEVAMEGVVKSTSLKRKHRALLSDAGCLTEIIRGWYLLTAPETNEGSTAWFGGYWAFLKYYLSDRFGDDGYCLSAESSIDVLSGTTAIPSQLAIFTKKASNAVLNLPHNLSVLFMTGAKNIPDQPIKVNGVNALPMDHAVCMLSPSYFRNHPQNIEIVLKQVSLPVSRLSAILLEKDFVASAQRIIGAYKAVGEHEKAKSMKSDLEAVGHQVLEVNPLNQYKPMLTGLKFTSPYAGRIRVLWQTMKADIESVVPHCENMRIGNEKLLKRVEQLHKIDAYHSLSIEGYQVTEELIQKIESGVWSSEREQTGKDQVNKLAAQGYLKAFITVTESIKKMMERESPGEVVEKELDGWYRELFTPMFRANMLPPERAAGYRRGPAYIKNSRFVPPPYTAVIDCMEEFFRLLKEETHPFVRAILGHFIFTFIHPYLDGNGRIGRFIMNAMLVSGGLPWTVIRNTERSGYMEALETASVHGDIVPFVNFILSEMKSKI